MPIYDFRCRACGERFERAMHMDEFDEVRASGSVECPKCKVKDSTSEIESFQVQTQSKTM